MASPERPPRVVILGAGFAGLAAARELCGKGVDVTIVDRQNHHVFQPLLYQVATAGLSPADIAAPIRSIVKKHERTHVRLGEVVAVNSHARLVELAEGVKMMTNIINCPQTPEALQLDMPVELAPTKVNDEITLPTWQPAKGA